MPINEVTVQKVLYAGRKSQSGKTIPFDALVTAELGVVSLQKGQVKNFKESHVYEIGYTEQGEYKNDGTFLKDLAKETPPPKQYTKARTDPIESVRLGAHGMTNALLSGWAQGRALDEILQTPNDKFRLLLDKMEQVELSSHMQGTQAQRRDDMNDEIKF